MTSPDGEETSKTSPNEISPPIIEKGYGTVDTVIEVDFDGPDDQTNPLNWSGRYKWAMVALLAIISLTG